MYAVILASGKGTRLWPLSRNDNPKQFHALVGKKSLFRETFERMTEKFPVEKILVTVTENCLAEAEKILPELPKENFVVEPFASGTANVCARAAKTIYEKDPKATAIFVPADHLIEDNASFKRTLDFAQNLIEKYPKSIIQIGVNPTRPDTGLGYIQMDVQKEQSDGLRAFSVKKFIEKPNQKTAEAFVSSWEYLWNAGIYIFQIENMLKLYEKFLPDTMKALDIISKAKGTDREYKETLEQYKKIEKISIDYGIIEKADDILVIPANFGWSDVGSWGTLLESLAEKYDSKVIAQGHHVNINSENCLIMAGTKLVATVGLSDTIIIDTPDALLVCNKNGSQEVKELVEKLTEEGKHQYL